MYENTALAVAKAMSGGATYIVGPYYRPQANVEPPFTVGDIEFVGIESGLNGVEYRVESYKITMTNYQKDSNASAYKAALVTAIEDMRLYHNSTFTDTGVNGTIELLDEGGEFKFDDIDRWNKSCSFLVKIFAKA